MLRARILVCIAVPVFLLEVESPASASPIPNWTKNWSIQNTRGAYAKREGEFIRIGNQALERVYRLNAGTVSTIQYINKLSGREPGSQQGGEFRIVLSGAIAGEFAAPDFILDAVSTSDDADPLVVQFALTLRDHPELRATIHIETSGASAFQRKWLGIQWSGEGDVVADVIDVENTGGFGWWFEGTPSSEGMGQPLFVNDLYFGLEYPGAEVTNECLGHFPGRSVKNGFTSKSAIWGVAKNALATRDAFFENYLYPLTGGQGKPFVIWNLISTGLPEESGLVAAIASVSARAKKAGLEIDSYAIDDVWQDYTSVWQPDPIRFPRGLEPVHRASQEARSQLGLWLSLAGSSLDTRWGKARGLEVSQAGYRGPTSGRYCIAGPRYREELKAVLEHYTKADKVNYFKFDYNTFGCSDTSHGHGVGPASRDAQIDGYIDVLTQIKKTSPDCRIALTTGMWLSPWWMLYADYIWLGGQDMGEMTAVRNMTTQDSAITYRDAVMYEDFVEKRFVFPFSAVMTHGFWEVGGAPYDKFQDDVILTIGRGVTKYEILNSPESMDDKRLEFLARAINWGKRHWDVLSDTRMILGDPRKGEVYGYAHAGRDEALVFLRNPDLDSRPVSLAMGDIGLKPDSPILTSGQVSAHEIYPASRRIDWPGAASNLNVHVLGSQTMVIAVVANDTLPEAIRLHSGE